jgi:hypothetical protein
MATFEQAAPDGTRDNFASTDATVGGGIVPVYASTFANFKSGQARIDGVARALDDLSAGTGVTIQFLNRVRLQADPINSARVWVGPSGLTTGNGYLLEPNAEVELHANDLGLIYAMNDDGGPYTGLPTKLNRIFYIGN